MYFVQAICSGHQQRHWMLHLVLHLSRHSGSSQRYVLKHSVELDSVDEHCTGTSVQAVELATCSAFSFGLRNGPQVLRLMFLFVIRFSKIP